MKGLPMRTPKPMPSKETLQEGLTNNQDRIVETSKAFGVSYPTFRKWLNFYDLHTKAEAVAHA
jgi:hypothetical protein